MASDRRQNYETNVMTGEALAAIADGVRGLEQRDCYSRLRAYLSGEECDRVCLLYGLRGTGKRTMLRQVIQDMSPEDAARAAYIKATAGDTMAGLSRDLKRLAGQGYQFVFINEVTMVSGFIDSAALLSDIYAAQGMKIVLSGADSLCFWLALQRELYDRAIVLHTTFLAYQEHRRLLKSRSIDDYIRCGGALGACFQGDESAMRYIDSAVSGNIMRGLDCCGDAEHFQRLRPLCETGKLAEAVRLTIKAMSRGFLLSVLAGSAEGLPPALSEVLLRKEEPTLDPAQRAEIRKCLHALDLIVDCPIEMAEPGAVPIEHVLFTQPGMRYCQAQALVHSLMKEPQFAALSELEKERITGRILVEVRGRMMEEIVLLESAKALGSRFRVFEQQFAAGEFDMVIYDTEANQCGVYKIKHSEQAVPEQYSHLTDPEKCLQTQRRFGEIVERCVLYRGPEQWTKSGVHYQNVGSFLKHIPDEVLRIAQEKVNLPAMRFDL